VVGWEEGNVRIGKSKYFVVEADEYNRHFLNLQLKDLIITSIDYDHPDYFSSVEDTERVFEELAEKLPEGARIVAHNPISTWHVETADGLGEFVVPIPGKHMQMNASLAVTMATLLGVAEEEAKEALKSFKGLERRFEMLGEIGGMKLVSDYGHHPAEIKATLETAKEMHPSEKILAVFEAHTYSRLNAFWDDYIQALQGVDGVLVAPVYRARNEEVEGGRSGEELAIALRRVGLSAEYFASYEELSDAIEKRAGKYKIAIAFTAGEMDYYLRSLAKNKR
jgi:UDP-N-acetylmuramate--alanine ligase